MSTLSNARLGSANTYDTAVRNISERQVALSSLQENLTSGKRVVRASDDPNSAAIAERALTRISRIATDQRALASQVNAITQAESTLGGVTEALQRFRELTVSAGNGTYGPTERKTIAMEMQGLRDQIYALANSEDSNGQPFFSALGSALKPFVGPQASAQDYAFNGLPGQSASSNTTIPFTLDGDSAFMLQTNRDGVYNVSVGGASSTLRTGSVALTPAPTPPTPSPLVPNASYTITFGAVVADPVSGKTTASYDIVNSGSGATVSLGTQTYNTGQSFTVTEMPGLSLDITGTPAFGDKVQIDASPSLFSVLDDAIRDIGSATSNSSASQAVSQALGNIDIGMGRVSAVRGQAGELLNRADRISGNQEKRNIQMEAERSRAEDLDMIKGISDFQNQQTGYQVAMQTYAQIQKLSLFNYIG